jgi:hypothetical protein
MHGVIEHDHWCAIYRGHDCSCVPDISLVPHTGGDVIVVKSDGGVGKLRRQ